MLRPLPRPEKFMLIDTHCHLDFPDFDEEREALIARAREAGVTQMVTISTEVGKFDQVKAVAEQFANVFCSAGTHPNHASDEPDLPVEAYIEAAAYEKCVAIGEAGLDYHYDYATPEVQKPVFRRQIEAARITGLPLVIHARSADEDMAAILREEMDKGAFSFILHCFSSGPELARTGVELGGYVSFSGILTFPKSTELREIAATVPHDRLLVETDAPYLAPKPFRGKRNEPSYVAYTAAVLAETIGLSLEDTHALTTENAFRCFFTMPRV
jgi:TatD DNase family protein